MYTDQEVLNWNLTQADLDVCAECGCDLFFPAEDQMHLAAKTSTLARAKCVCGHIRKNRAGYVVLQRLQSGHSLVARPPSTLHAVAIIAPSQDAVA